jgi:chromosome partitioning protein
MKTITFCSFKGGTAKTSTTLHLGACLVKYHKKRVLLIDFDSQANLSTGVGLGRDCLDAMPAALSGEKKLTDIIKPTCIKGLDAAPANIYLDGIENNHKLVNDHYSHERLRKCLKDLDYDFCFIDTPPSLGWLSESAFYAANYSIICATPEPYSLLGLQRLRDHHENIRENHNLDVLGVVLTFWDSRGAANSAYVDSIETYFNGKLFETKIRRDSAVNRSILKGKPVIEIEELARVSQDYQSLSKEFLSKVGGAGQELGDVINKLIESKKHEVKR